MRGFAVRPMGTKLAALPQSRHRNLYMYVRGVCTLQAEAFVQQKLISAQACIGDGWGF